MFERNGCGVQMVLCGPDLRNSAERCHVHIYRKESDIDELRASQLYFTVIGHSVLYRPCMYWVRLVSVINELPAVI